MIKGRIKGYYVDLAGKIFTVVEYDGKFYNSFGEVLLEDSGGSISVLDFRPLGKDLREHGRYILWKKLTDLLKAIKVA